MPRGKNRITFLRERRGREKKMPKAIKCNYIIIFCGQDKPSEPKLKQERFES